MPMSFRGPVVDVSVVVVSVATVSTVVADSSSLPSPHPTAASATTASPMEAPSEYLSSDSFRR